MIIGIMIFVLLGILSNSAFAQQTLHDKRISEVVNQNSRAQESPQIDVEAPSHGIDVNEREDIVHVVKSNRDSVPVISGENHRKIGEDIPVGNGPSDIAVNENTNTVYVANAGSQSVSLIDGETNDVVVGATFYVIPFGSGRILCDETGNASPDDLTAPPPSFSLRSFF